MTAGTRRERRLVRVLGSHAVPFSGAAVVHRETASRLGPALGVDFDVDDAFLSDTRLARRVLGRRELPVADVCIATSTPLPAIIRSHHLLPLVYDLRWRWTRGIVGRSYRRTDLWQTVKRAGRLVNISETVARQIRQLGVIDDDEVHVIDLGPGQVEGATRTPVTGRQPSVVLIGSAPHKRNELAAELLVQVPEVVRDFTVRCVSVSESTRAILEKALPSSRLQFGSRLDANELATVYSRATTYLSLGFSEGFGFPYIESAYCGCDVIVPRIELTTELFGEHANYLTTIDPTVDELRNALTTDAPARTQQLQASARARSWQTSATQLAALVRRTLDDRS